MDESKKIYRVNVNDPNIAEEMGKIRRDVMSSAPKHIKKLGKILRARSLWRFKRFLAKYGHAGKVDDLKLFMDYLITQRIDLKDMAEEARANLRDHTLRNEDESCKTEDYKSMHPDTTCKSCRWFMEIPPDEESHCVALGAMGYDAPCYGFTEKLKA